MTPNAVVHALSLCSNGFQFKISEGNEFVIKGVVDEIMVEEVKIPAYRPNEETAIPFVTAKQTDIL